MDAESAAHLAADKAGWTDSTLIKVMAWFIDRQELAGEFREYMDKIISDEYTISSSSDYC